MITPLNIIIGILVVMWLLVGYVIYKYMGGRLSSSIKQQIREEWERILYEKDWKHAIMQADTLLDHTLKHFRYQGSMGDKLKKAEKLFSNLNRVWNAHKTRNRIAHEMHFKVTHDLYRECMAAFKQALHDLKVL